MKKLLFILMFIGIMMLSSCKPAVLNGQNYGHTSYFVSGIYLEIEETESPSLEYGDYNPKIYTYPEGDKYIKATYGGTHSAIGEGANSFTEKDDYYLCYMKYNIKIYGDVTSFKVHPIYYEDGKFTVDTSLSQTVNISSSTYEYSVRFNYEKTNYRVIVSLIFS